MKLVILAGGFGTRLSEETVVKPKPMVEIGGKPIIWHIMKYYSQFGVKEFIICLGYKGQEIIKYFVNYKFFNSDISIDLKNDEIKVLKNLSLDEHWKINLVDTGLNTMTGGRLLSIKKYFKKNEDFFFTYGDGLSNVNLKKLLNFHKSNKKQCTITAIRQPTKYGKLDLSGSSVLSFHEKNKNQLRKEGWINGGFFVVNSSAISFINEEKTSWEFDTLPKLTKKKQLNAFKHEGFWQCMDTLRDKNYLENLWNSGDAPWKIWK